MCNKKFKHDDVFLIDRDGGYGIYEIATVCGGKEEYRMRCLFSSYKDEKIPEKNGAEIFVGPRDLEESEQLYDWRS